MPQFDLASFYPQITFFVGIFLMFYVFITKNTLPKISQNLKLNKKILELYNQFSVKEFKDVNLLSYIHKPSNILSYLIYKESICLLFLQQSAKIITNSYIASLN
jgi:hypothetical protein